MARLIKRVWENTMLTIKTKTQVYQACVLSTLLYGGESWTLYTRQERRLNTSHLRCLRRILGISWQDHIPNTEVLARAGTLSMYALLTKRRLLAADRSCWQHTTKSAIKTAEQKREEQWEEKRTRRHQRAETEAAPSDDNVFTCSNCNRVCRSRIGLYSHSRCCGSTTD